MKFWKMVLLLVLAVMISAVLSSCKWDDILASPSSPPPAPVPVQPGIFAHFTYFNAGDCRYAGDVGKFLASQDAKVAPDRKSANIIITSSEPWYEGADLRSWKVRVTVRFKGSIILSSIVGKDEAGVSSGDQESLMTQIK